MAHQDRVQESARSAEVRKRRGSSGRGGLHRLVPVPVSSVAVGSTSHTGNEPLGNTHRRQVEVVVGEKRKPGERVVEEVKGCVDVGSDEVDRCWCKRSRRKGSCGSQEKRSDLR